jgi:ABC-type Fe3+/spermidine/putrescine transport system ATPase subunit
MEITLDQVTKVYEGSTAAEPALSSVSARIGSGEFFFLLGPSGCGKTTLLRLIAGLIKPTSGRIFFNERDVTDLPVDKRDAALVFQGYALWPHMTVRANVEFGPKMRRMPSAERRRLAMEQLTRVQMEAFADRKPNELSGGQQQRVALARALAAQTECILLDEPLSSLDARLRLHMRDELRSLVKSSGVTAIYVTHDQKEALSMADRIAVMNAGQIVQIGTAEDVYIRPATRFVADFLGEANFLEGRVQTVGKPSRVETALGDVLCADEREITAGAAVTCCVRPEHIRIESAPQGAGATSPAEGGENCLPATIASSVYLGDVRQFVCALEDGETEWRVEQLAGPSSLGAGDRVNLRFAADRVAMLES